MAHPRTYAVCWSLLLAAAGCQTENATLMMVKIIGKDGVVSSADAPVRTRIINTLEATFVQGADHPLFTTLSSGASVNLPSSFVLRADGLEGPMELSLKARDDCQSLGQGTASGELMADKSGELTVTLLPDDFALNSNITGEQFFSQKAGFGRELASNSNGDFVAVWEDGCVVSGQCDIYYRLFDRTGTPKRFLNDTKEQVANIGKESHDQPSVAMQVDGSFVIAWQRSASNNKKIFSRAFTADGQGVPLSSGGGELEISGSDVSNTVEASAPFVLATNDGYVVLWQQISGNRWEVKGRLLGTNGVPVADYQGTNGPFLVAFWDVTRPSTCGNGQCEAAESCMNCSDDCLSCGAWPVAAASLNGGFLAVWNLDGIVAVHGYESQGRPYGNHIAITDIATPKVLETAVTVARETAQDPTFVVAWSTTLSAAPDTDGTCIRMERFDPVAVLGWPVFTANTTTKGNQRSPAAATLADGTVLVTWQTDANSSDEPAGGIRGRAFLPNLLAAGADFPINTTVTSQQRSPALAAHGAEGFVAAFVDLSKSCPDTSESGIRGRVVYPDLAPTNGQLGSVCEANLTCGSGFSCQNLGAAPLGWRCVERCVTVNADCQQGGLCKKTSTGEIVCLSK